MHCNVHSYLQYLDFFINTTNFIHEDMSFFVLTNIVSFRSSDVNLYIEQGSEFPSLATHVNACSLLTDLEAVQSLYQLSFCVFRSQVERL